MFTHELEWPAWRFAHAVLGQEKLSLQEAGKAKCDERAYTY